MFVSLCDQARNKQLTHLQLIGMARGVAAGMTYLSGMNFIHRVGIRLFKYNQSSEYPFSRALIGYLNSGYPVTLLVCKTEWRAWEKSPFLPSFDQIKFIFYRWLFTGLVHTKTIIRGSGLRWIIVKNVNYTTINTFSGLSINLISQTNKQLG